MKISKDDITVLHNEGYLKPSLLPLEEAKERLEGKLPPQASISFVEKSSDLPRLRKPSTRSLER